MSIEALQKAISIVGSQAELARRLKCDRWPLMGQKHIHKWLSSPNPLLMPPAEYCPDIEAITAEFGTRVPCEELRPDVRWDVIRCASCSDASSVLNVQQVENHSI